jgi:phenylacetate-CoA ligase
VLRALAEHFRDHGGRPGKLRGLRSISETLSEETRVLCREVFGLPIVDAYSSMEVGYIALQCPEQPHYHLQSETVRTEVLREDGTPCEPGEVGRVVVTPLHNFATILIRYELGDYAEVGEPCLCGRGLPVIRHIAGRVRNLLTLPDGRKVWPRLKTTAYGEVAPVHQLQLVQTSLTHIEARFAVDRPVTTEEQNRLREAIHDALGHPFEVSFTWFENEIPRSPGGKFEDFRSDITS